MRVTDRITRAVRRERAVELIELLNRETGEPKTEGEVREVLAAVESTLRSAAHLPAPRPTKEQIFGPVLTDSEGSPSITPQDPAPPRSLNPEPAPTTVTPSNLSGKGVSSPAATTP